jgi:Spy/CpxP family protein refolding chaperone
MVVLGLVILGSGIVIGSVGTLVVVKRGIADAVQHPERIPERTVDRMARRYDLTDEQRAKVEAILTTRLQRMAQIRRRIRPHVDAQLDSLREDVAEVLSEKQAAQWREDFKRLRRVVQVPMYAPQAPESEAGGESVAE